MKQLTFKQLRKKYSLAIIVPSVVVTLIALDLNKTRKYKIRLAEEKAQAKKVAAETLVD